MTGMGRVLDATSHELVSLGLSPKTLEAIRRLGVTDVGQLVERSEGALRSSGFTDKQVADVSGSLALVGMTLRPESPSPVSELESAAVTPYEATIEPPWVAVESSQPGGAGGAFHELVDAPDRGNHGDTGRPTMEGELETRAVFEDFLNSRPKRARRGPPALTDDKRAAKFVERAEKRKSRGPRLDDPADRARIEALRQTLLMDVVDAAWLCGISKDAMYAACRKGTVPVKQLGSRYRVITQALFEELFPATAGRLDEAS